uniref:t-SNARE coiled-coil homology domain-containing protein n=1 Tax=Maylandia zebra TaxID=106582 RepID=A0A3P9CMP1_9CICH
MKEIHELFLQMAILVEEQGSMLNNIEAHVCNTVEYIEKVHVHMKKAIQYKRKNPFLQSVAINKGLILILLVIIYVLNLIICLSSCLVLFVVVYQSCYMNKVGY